MRQTSSCQERRRGEGGLIAGLIAIVKGKVIPPVHPKFHLKAFSEASQREVLSHKQQTLTLPLWAGVKVQVFVKGLLHNWCFIRFRHQGLLPCTDLCVSCGGGRGPPNTPQQEPVATHAEATDNIAAGGSMVGPANQEIFFTFFFFSRSHHCSILVALVLPGGLMLMLLLDLRGSMGVQKVGAVFWGPYPLMQSHDPRIQQRPHPGCAGHLLQDLGEAAA